MRVPNLERLIQEVEQQQSDTDYHGHRPKVIRSIMIYERAQHLLATREHQLAYSKQSLSLTCDEVIGLSKQAVRMGGGGLPIHKALLEEYGAPSIQKGKPVYGTIGLHIAINKLVSRLQDNLTELDAQYV